MSIAEDDALSLATLVAKLRFGDDTAFRELYLTFHARLWKFAYGYVYSRDGAEDIVHDVFLSLWDRRETLDVRDNLRVWLYGAVRNRALQQLRHQRVIERTERDVGAHVRDAPAMGTSGDNPDERIMAEQTVDVLQRVIASFPEKRRVAVTLRWSHGMGYEDIAQLLGISAQAARVHVARAKAELEAAIEKTS